MVADILWGGFAAARHRLGLVLLDIFWKSVWLVVTLVMLFVAFTLITSELTAIEWQDTGIPGLNGLVAMAILREFWAANRGEIIALFMALVFVSALIWFVLEAFCRRKIDRDTQATFNLFLVSGILKAAVLVATGFLLLLVARAGAPAIAIVTFAAMAFFLTLIETLIRADAVDLLGTDLIRVAGLLGILLSFETMVAGSLGAVLVAGFSNVAQESEAAVMFGAAAIAVVFLNILHGYLLLVRFSAIAIMRRNVVEV